ncbi:MAG TPA: hypothetical protein ENG33_08990 [Chloroflexi bacterium]|nr:hypothetical protein [Chloroflexota bacterium]
MNQISQHLIEDARQFLRSPSVQDVGILTIGQYVAAAIGFLTTTVAARILGPEGYGQAALILAFPSLLRSVGNFKSLTVTTRYLAGFRATGKGEEFRAITKLGYIIDELAFLGVFLTVLITGKWVAEHVYNASWMFRGMLIYAASFVILAFRGGSFAVLTAFEKFRWLSALYVLEKGLTFILVIAFLLAGHGVIGLVLGMAISNALMGLISLGTATLLQMRNGIGVWWAASLGSIRSLRRELLSFFSWNYVMTTLSGAIAQVPVMILGAVRGPDEAGFFRLAMTLVNVSSYPMNAAHRVAYPRLSAKWAKKESDAALRRDVKRWTLHGGVPIGLAILGVTLALPLIIPLVFGENYRPVVPGVQLMMLGVAFESVFFWLNSFYYALGKVGLWVGGYSLYAAPVLGLSWFISQRWGFVGLAGLVAGGRCLFKSVMLTMSRRIGREVGG